jgi:salicylate hydroxylase
MNNGFPWAGETLLCSGGALRIHRTDLRFIRHLPVPGTEIYKNAPCTLYLRHRLVDYVHDGPEDFEPITLHFDGKPSTKCDILIGADGVKSTVRQLFLSQLPNSECYDKYRDLVWSSFVAYRGLVSRDELEHLHPGHRAVTHPRLIVGGIHINLVL